MRTIVKVAPPDILVQNEATWTNDLINAIADEARKNASNRYRHTSIRATLKLETFGKCAYCESNPGAVSYDHIEHIYPKSIYPERTFDWINLTIACAKCNGKKLDLDPTAANFVNPYGDNPESRFYFVGSVMAGHPGDQAAIFMIARLDLNRADLVMRRAKAVEEVINVYNTAGQLEKELRRDFVDASIDSLTAEEEEYIQAKRFAIIQCEEKFSSIF